MPPRAPGTLSNGVLSLKFMQRGLAADQKPVEAEKAVLIDDSHWEIIHSPEKKQALLNAERQKGLDVTYEASYLPFLYDLETSESEDMPGPPSPSAKVTTFNGRRVFRGGQEVQAREAVGEPQDDQQEESDEHGDSPSMVKDEPVDPPSKPKGRQTRPLFKQNAVPSNPGKPQFLRPADVDVPAAETSGVRKAETRGKSKSDMLSEMIASAKASTSTTPKVEEDYINLKESVRRSEIL
ncbi:hypothetical protein M408DRAFT_10735 [Serendipita vermifera MAFF 305830]|uniref:Uncharacterized protein n=1 Tax=Serendipita vermifera MAFF 305830 TaxID=933852 RepID=A0A0C3AXY8_SERVB|nr:hypothetical protein M408DRAFT_10735 [Serendipita vermifera MAFF 305830]